MKILSYKTWVLGISFCAVTGLSGLSQAADLPDPDGKPADMTKPVQVFILMGQSNMVGAGQIEKSLKPAVEKGLYPFLVDDEGKWTTRQDVKNVFVMERRGSMRLMNDEFMTVKGRTIGPELGIGHHLGNIIDAPVLILKSAIGNRSLGWDLLPPGSKQYEMDGKVYAGYKESPDVWDVGTEPKKIGWYAGKQYDDDVKNAKVVLSDLAKYYPGATGYEVKGFIWWQGDKDRYKEAHAKRYEENLVALIKSLRKDFDAPEAKFVMATLGQTSKESKTGNEALIFDAMMKVGSGEHPEFGKSVATVYTHPLSKGGASNNHYKNDAETYMNVGLGLGEKMVELLK